MAQLGPLSGGHCIINLQTHHEQFSVEPIAWLEKVVGVAGGKWAGLDAQALRKATKINRHGNEARPLFGFFFIVMTGRSFFGK